MPWFFSPVARIRHATQKRLAEVTPHSKDFYILISFSSALAALGLLMNNTAVIIGAMVVAPLVTPLFVLSLSVLILQGTDLWRSLLSIVFGTLLSLFVAAAIGSIASVFATEQTFITGEILSRSKPDMLYFVVACISGLAGTFAYARPKIKEFVTGIAIAAAIIPPIAVAGIALSINNMFLFRQSMLLYAFNIVGICFGSILMFVVLGFGKELEKTNSTTQT
ncbi:MAG: hypothetical protein CO029_01445 [Candidatus Magasanikbacteria bacterium CG_4_9_14_0_2_um_filter_41_10]|uniref:TIGR00341 family protein n=1 Tax=Candidatus Magasanikbacteria bacterium CG_4_10_14_0_2_um_filter_41_31 TaxID=1974639 RepID=A0A2M7V582_9BACT|nr:MAG: hypothetical protein AUJ37_03975 [Candidatus Magasanikbacteria bacterium CG1_02_41_34]PIZ93671.1 MAG: hypothetical protein COX83_01315 [Candidatus Magasanikbacteria bacterium CG_4_10_14_0_2_um_filter_41_31]PJC53693.1 MAG: hypothetical protein CO029_01445 [Candidatus Magasanikbacteria bacterium CG_4_9_14_0_2_um_filter_41_10]